MIAGSTTLTAAIHPAVDTPRLELADDPDTLAESTRWLATPAGQREGVSQLRLSGLHCAACAGIIETALGGVNGVLDARVSAGASRAEVRWDPARTRLSALLHAVHDAGYGAVPDAAASAHEQRRSEQRRALWRLFVAGFCMMQVMMFSAPLYFAAPGSMPADVQRLLQWASWLLTLPVLLFAAGPFFSGAWRSLRARRIGMDVPVALGLAVTFVATRQRRSRRSCRSQVAAGAGHEGAQPRGLASAMKLVAMAVLWPAFLMAGVLEALTFAVLDPSDMHWFGGAPVELSRHAVYTLTFLLYWTVISTAAALTVPAAGHPWRGRPLRPDTLADMRTLAALSTPRCC